MKTTFTVVFSLLIGISASAQWQDQSVPLEGNGLRSVEFISTDMGWAVGDGGVILYTDDAGNIWKEQNGGTNTWLKSIDFTDPANGWAVGAGGTIIHTNNGGISWNQQESGTESESLLCDVTFVTTEIGWAVGSDGIILHTENGGENWEVQSSGVTNSLQSVFFLDMYNGWAVGWGSIVHTSDGGNN